MTNIPALKAKEEARWAVAKPTRSATAGIVAKHLLAAKPRYQAVESRTGVPWWFIAAVHERESSQNWNTQLGQGDPLNRVSKHVPAGRGPFKSWEDGAVDALVNCPPFAARNKDWSIGDALAMWVKYNGLIYDAHGRPSPYVWSGTSVYDPPTGSGGKVLVDHGPIENVVDKQLGCAAMLLAMMEIDPSISFAKPASKPAPPAPHKADWIEAIINILASIFRRK